MPVPVMIANTPVLVLVRQQRRTGFEPIDLGSFLLKLSIWTRIKQYYEHHDNGESNNVTDGSMTFKDASQMVRTVAIQLGFGTNSGVQRPSINGPDFKQTLKLVWLQDL
jgi:hypothetical protein